MNPRPNDWNNFWQGQDRGRFKTPSWSKRRIMGAVGPFIDSGQRILDAGCGSGFFSKYFCDAGLETYSLDYSDEALQMTAGLTENRAKILKEDLLSPQLPSRIGQRFDAIFSDGLLEHYTAAEQSRLMANFRSLLCDGGRLITFVPNRFSPWELIRPLYMPGIEETPFVLSQLLQLNVTHDFEILQKGGVNTVPFRWSPDSFLGPWLGMLLYVVARKK